MLGACKYVRMCIHTHTIRMYIFSYIHITMYVCTVDVRIYPITTASDPIGDPSR